MTGPNTLQPTEPARAAEPSYVEAAGALAVSATEPDTSVMQEGIQAITESVPPPREPKMTSWRAMEGPHPTWIGFSAITGEPKVKR